MSDSPFLDEHLPASAPADARWVWAVVTQASPLRIRLDGDRTPLAITPDDMGGFLRPLGQRVYCQILNRRLVVIGPGSGVTALAVTDTSTLDLTLTGNPTIGYSLKGDVITTPETSVVPTWNANFRNASPVLGGAPAIRKVGSKIIIDRFSVENATSLSLSTYGQATAGTMPAGSRPAETIHIPALASLTGVFLATGQILIDSAGGINVQTTVAFSGASAGAMYWNTGTISYDAVS